MNQIGIRVTVTEQRRCSSLPAMYSGIDVTAQEVRPNENTDAERIHPDRLANIQGVSGRPKEDS